jgi:hypothetical protein
VEAMAGVPTWDQKTELGTKNILLSKPTKKPAIFSRPPILWARKDIGASKHVLEW